MNARGPLAPLTFESDDAAHKDRDPEADEKRPGGRWGLVELDVHAVPASWSRSRSRSRKKLRNVRMTAMAASWPMSLHVGAIAERMMSAASSNSSASISQLPNSRNALRRTASVRSRSTKIAGMTRTKRLDRSDRDEQRGPELDCGGDVARDEIDIVLHYFTIRTAISRSGGSRCARCRGVDFMFAIRAAGRKRRQ